MCATSANPINCDVDDDAEYYSLAMLMMYLNFNFVSKRIWLRAADVKMN